MFIRRCNSMLKYFPSLCQVKYKPFICEKEVHLIVLVVYYIKNYLPIMKY